MGGIRLLMEFHQAQMIFTEPSRSRNISGGRAMLSPPHLNNLRPLIGPDIAWSAPPHPPTPPPLFNRLQRF